MTRKRHKPIPVGTISAIDVTRARMPRHDGWVCRGGPHGDTAYNRRREKAELKRILSEEGDHGRPPFFQQERVTIPHGPSPERHMADDRAHPPSLYSNSISIFSAKEDP